MPEPRTPEEWTEQALKGAMIPGGIEIVADYHARVARAIQGYAAQQTAALREQNDIDIINGEAWAERAREAEQELAVLRRAVGGALDCLPGCDAEAHEEDCPAADPAEGYGTLQRERDALVAEVERLTKELTDPFDAEHIISAVAVAVGPASARCVRHYVESAKADREALVAVAKAVHEFIRPRESGSHPGSGGDPATLERLYTLQETLAHPAVQRAVKEKES